MVVLTTCVQSLLAGMLHISVLDYTVSFIDSTAVDVNCRVMSCVALEGAYDSTAGVRSRKTHDVPDRIYKHILYLLNIIRFHATRLKVI